MRDVLLYVLSGNVKKKPFYHKLTKTSLLFIVVLQFISWRHAEGDAKALAALLLN